MNKLLDIQTTVFDQIKDNDMTIGKICTFAHVNKRTIDGWNRKEPTSITDLKRINQVLEITDKLKTLDVYIELKDNILSISIGGSAEFTDQPINQQIRDICKQEMKKDYSDDELLRFIKVFKVCR